MRNMSAGSSCEGKHLDRQMLQRLVLDDLGQNMTTVYDGLLEIEQDDAQMFGQRSCARPIPCILRSRTADAVWKHPR